MARILVEETEADHSSVKIQTAKRKNLFRLFNFISGAAKNPRSVISPNANKVNKLEMYPTVSKGVFIT